MRVLSLFAGIEGLGKGFEDAGAQVVGQVEIDKFCRRVLAWHYPNVPRWEDVRNVGKRELPACDVLTGGFPCQDLSVAGRRAGLAGKRSGLFWEVVRIAGELAPEWLCLENVPGLLSSQEGRDFQTVLDALGELGYSVVWRVLDAQYFGVAQRRRRVFIIGHLGNPASAAQVLFELESCDGDSPPSRGKGKGTARGFEVGPGANSFVDIAPTLDTRCKDGPIRNQIGCGVMTYASPVIFQQNQRNEIRQMQVAGALQAEAGMKQQKYLAFNPQTGGDMRLGIGDTATALQANQITGTFGVAGVRRLTPTECEALQGFPQNWTAVDGDKTPDSPRYRALGNAVCVNVARWVARRMLDVERRA